MASLRVRSDRRIACRGVDCRRVNAIARRTESAGHNCPNVERENAMSNVPTLVYAAGLSLIAAMAPVMATAADPQKTVILVHGAFVDGSSWSRVIPLLQADGLRVIAVQNPLTSLADDVAATKRA